MMSDEKEQRRGNCAHASGDFNPDDKPRTTMRGKREPGVGRWPEKPSGTTRCVLEKEQIPGQ
jgi:hypothetical protein